MARRSREVMSVPSVTAPWAVTDVARAPLGIPDAHVVAHGNRRCQRGRALPTHVSSRNHRAVTLRSGTVHLGVPPSATGRRERAVTDPAPGGEFPEALGTPGSGRPGRGRKPGTLRLWHEHLVTLGPSHRGPGRDRRGRAGGPPVRQHRRGCDPGHRGRHVAARSGQGHPTGLSGRTAWPAHTGPLLTRSACATVWRRCTATPGPSTPRRTRPGPDAGRPDGGGRPATRRAPRVRRT